MLLLAFLNETNVRLLKVANCKWCCSSFSKVDTPQKISTSRISIFNYPASKKVFSIDILIFFLSDRVKVFELFLETWQVFKKAL
jgi:hypothetical protein